jgi:urease accessory protein
MNTVVTPIAAATALSTADQGWSANLELTLEPRGGRTCLTRCVHNGPLRVQRPFYPEGDVSHIYILHPPGGLVAGDRLAISAACSTGARALLTTPAAGRVYHSNREQLPQIQDVELDVAAGACCEWLPQENILFDGALAHNRVRVMLAPGAEYTGWEITCLGRPAAGELFASGRLVQRCEIWRGDQPLLIENSRIIGGSPQLAAPWGLQGRTVLATLVSTQVSPELVHKLRAIIAARRHDQQNGADDREPVLAAVTALPELLVVRVLADSAAEVKALFIALWRELRLSRWGVAASAPRIWSS